MADSIIKYFRLLYDPVHFPVQVINDEGKIVYVNQAFTFQWGYNISELNEYKIFNDSELKKKGVLASILNTFETKGFNFVDNYADSLLISKEVTIPIFRTKIFYVGAGEKDFVVLFHEDQTEMVLTEAEVKKARDGNKEAERLKDTFLTVLSHELRTPLNIILGYSSIIKESMKDKVSPEDRIYLDNLYSGSERLFKSITQMLEFAQIEAGNYVMNIETAELLTILKSALNQIQKAASEKKLDVKTKFHDTQLYVDVDVQSLESALNNLLSNAVKFTRQGFIEIETSVLYERDLAVCKIKDSGIGISTEYLDHLFRPFSQEDLNVGRNFEGNGLGLALAKRYIEKMGGSLLVDSIKGVGTTFTFTLPLSQSKTTKAKGNGESKLKSLKKLFILDDLSESYELINAFLKNKYVIDSKNLNDFSQEIIEQKDVEAFVIDVAQIQWQKCLDICKTIKREDPLKRPVIVISSEFIEEKIKQFYDAGADKFLVKPFSKSDLVGTLESLSI